MRAGPHEESVVAYYSHVLVCTRHVRYRSAVERSRYVEAFEFTCFTWFSPDFDVVRMEGGREGKESFFNQHGIVFVSIMFSRARKQRKSDDK